MTPKDLSFGSPPRQKFVRRLSQGVCVLEDEFQPGQRVSLKLILVSLEVAYRNSMTLEVIPAGLNANRHTDDVALELSLTPQCLGNFADSCDVSHLPPMNRL